MSGIVFKRPRIVTIACLVVAVLLVAGFSFKSYLEKIFYQQMIKQLSSRGLELKSIDFSLKSFHHLQVKSAQVILSSNSLGIEVKGLDLEYNWRQQKIEDITLKSLQLINHEQKKGPEESISLSQWGQKIRQMQVFNSLTIDELRLPFYKQLTTSLSFKKNEEEVQLQGKLFDFDLFWQVIIEAKNIVIKLKSKELKFESMVANDYKELALLDFLEAQITITPDDHLSAQINYKHPLFKTANQLMVNGPLFQGPFQMQQSFTLQEAKGGRLEKIIKKMVKENGQTTSKEAGPWQMSYELKGRCRGQMTWSVELKLNSNCSYALAMDYENPSNSIAVDKLKGKGVVHFELPFNPQKVLKGVQEIEIKKVTLPINNPQEFAYHPENIKWQIRQQGPWFLFDQWQMTLGEGRVELLGLKWNMTTHELSDLDIHVKSWPLENLLDLAFHKKFKASGIMAGSIPLRWQNKKATISKAHLSTLAPGHLSYGEEAGAALSLGGSSYGTDLVVNYLKDFDYQEFTFKGDSDDNYDGKFTLTLLGKNSKVENGRQLKLNINWKVNLLKLLQANENITRMNERFEKVFTNMKRGSK